MALIRISHAVLGEKSNIGMNISGATYVFREKAGSIESKFYEQDSIK